MTHECDQITGALDRLRAWIAVASEVWDKSTKTPSRFISSIKDRPKGLG